MVTGSRTGWRVGTLCVIAAIGVAFAALHAPVPQDAAYHDFADQRTILGVPHFANVVSNVMFLVSGSLGLYVLVVARGAGVVASIRSAYLWFFAAATLVSFGSAYYHLHPSNETLFWDRLPMSVSFMAFLAMVIGEHISPRLAKRLLAPLIIVGVLSVAYWALTERVGRGDLRPYYLVQYLPMVLLPVVLLLFPSTLTKVSLIWFVLLSYGLAKLFELFDASVYAAVTFVSGHTLKHVVAGAGLLLVVLAVRTRNIAVATPDDVGVA